MIVVDASVFIDLIIDSQSFKDELRDINGKTYSPKEYLELRNSVNSDR